MSPGGTSVARPSPKSRSLVRAPAAEMRPGSAVRPVSGFAVSE